MQINVSLFSLFFFVVFSNDDFFPKVDDFSIDGNIKPAKYYESNQIMACFVLLKNSWNAKVFVSQWLTYVQDERAVTDMPNTLGQPNHNTWRDHRHDQSILSLLAK